jgi:hypothetical protein
LLGTYQQSNLRIEIDATADTLRDSLTKPDEIKAWLWPQPFQGDFQSTLTVGTRFSSLFGPLTLEHQVSELSPSHICLLLHGSIDGFHEWRWGDGWLQSRLEGVSLLPLSLAQTRGILRLRWYLSRKPAKPS